MIRLLLTFYILLLIQSLGAYKIPQSTIKVYSPKGFEVSIPDRREIDRFIFSANLNKKIQKHVYGDFTDILSKPDNTGNWTYTNSEAALKVGDTLYYWITVTKEGKIYKEASGSYKVKSYEANPLKKFDTSALKDASQYSVPEPNIEVYCKGFKVSIPHEVGITAFTFSANINNGKKDFWDVMFEPDTSGNWTYTNSFVKLNTDDELYYKIFVTKNARIHHRDNGIYIVKNIKNCTAKEPADPIATSQYKIPAPKIEVYPEGFEVSIADADGIERFYFNANLNSKIRYFDVGKFSESVWEADENKRWTYKNTDAKLKVNDILYYWFIVQNNGDNYLEADGVYKVEKIITPPHIGVFDHQSGD